MNEHDPHDNAPDVHGDMLGVYKKVFGALALLTIMSFGAYEIFKQGPTSMWIILTISVIKASLVIYIFMHLKYDWRLVYGIMIPVVVMAIMMVIVLLPDIVMGWH